MRKFFKPPVVALALSLAAVGGYLALYALGAVGPARGEVPEGLVEEMPEIVLDDLNDRSTAITQFTDKPLIINFWATWCAPCLREIPMLKTFQDTHDDVQIVGIAIDRVDDVKRFAEEMQFNYPVLVGPNAMDAAGAFGVEYYALPFTIFAAAGGQVLGVRTGEVHPEHLAQLRGILDDLAADRIGIRQARSLLASRM